MSCYYPPCAACGTTDLGGGGVAAPRKRRLCNACYERARYHGWLARYPLAWEGTPAPSAPRPVPYRRSTARGPASHSLPPGWFRRRRDGSEATHAVIDGYDWEAVVAEAEAAAARWLARHPVGQHSAAAEHKGAA